MKKYRPSNGTEGEGFMDKFCFQCIHDDGKDKLCEIIANTMAFDIDEPEYPKEWIQEDDCSNPRCTNWVKWDWGNDGDPDDPENPKAPPPPPGPNQLDMFPLYPNEEHFEKEMYNKQLEI